MKFSQATGIRPGRKPEVHPSLSGVVLVQGAEGRGYAFVHFNEELVTRVGKALPFGINPENPAYLKILHIGEKWKVFAQYFERTQGALLAELDVQPEWLKVQYPARTQGASVPKNPLPAIPQKAT